jgi:hypothetical protein
MLLGYLEVIRFRLSFANDSYVIVSGRLVDLVFLFTLHQVVDPRDLVRSQIVPQVECPDTVSNHDPSFHGTDVKGQYLSMIGMSGKRIAPT